MKKIIYLLVLISLNMFSQTKYITKTGIVNFEASVPSVEEVKAKSETTTAILNTENGEFAALVFVKGFRFKNALMEEHFNENYAESDAFPKATFKGTLKDFSFEKLNTTSKFKMSGSLIFHGKTKPLNDVDFNIIKVGDAIKITGVFNVNVSDFGIEIPKVVKDKISEKVEISIDFSLKK